MIIAPDFLIGHIGKTAGDAVKQIMLKLRLPGIEIIPIDSPRKHMTFRQWGGDLESRRLVLTIRRLPAFLLSQYQHRIMDGRLAGLPTPEEICQDYAADYYLRLFTDEGQLRIDRWLRSEEIRADLADFLIERRRLSWWQLRRIYRQRTKARLTYSQPWTEFFAPVHLQTMYAVNPLWAEVERQTYGDLVTGAGSAAAA